MMFPIKVKVLKLWNKWLFWVLLLLFQLIVIYLLLGFGYLNNKLPYKVDDFIYKVGIWRVLGKKELKFEDYNMVNIDLRSNVFSDVTYDTAIEGFVREYVNIEGDVYSITLERMDKGNITFTAVKGFDSVSVKDCTDTSVDCYTAKFDKSAKDISIGDHVILVIRAKYDPEESHWGKEIIRVLVTKYIGSTT